VFRFSKGSANIEFLFFSAIGSTKKIAKIFRVNFTK